MAESIRAQAEQNLARLSGGSRTPLFLACGTEVPYTPVPLAVASTPYVTARVQAVTPNIGGGYAAGYPTANTGNVFITHKGGADSWVLTPGAVLELPPCCDLYDFDIATDVAEEGVVVMYST